MRDLLPEHDACVVIVPLTDDTRGLVDASFLAAMPDGALLVNAARGPVVGHRRADRRAHAAGGCAPRSTSPTPSRCRPTTRCGGRRACCSRRTSAAASRARCERAFAVAAEQIAAFARGERPPNLVENGY